MRGNPTEGGGAGMNHVLLYLYTNFVQVQAARLLKLAISLCFRCIGLPREGLGGRAAGVIKATNQVEKIIVEKK